MISIVFVIESLDCGGAEKSLVTLLNNLDYNLCKVDLILIKKGGDFEQFLPKQVNVIYCDFISTMSFTSKIKSRISFWLRRKVRKTEFHSAQLFWSSFKSSIPIFAKEYQIAIAYSQGFSTYYVAEKLKALKKITWLNTDYNKAGFNPKYDLNKYVLFDAIIAVSEQSKCSFIDAMQSIGVNMNLDVIKDITDDDLIKKRSFEEIGLIKGNEEINIVTVCRLSKEKGLHLAIDACKELVDKGKKIKWYVIGEGRERSFLEQRIRTEKLENNFILKGFKSNPYPYIRTSDIYVQTSLFEGLSLTVIEASILCKPIVTTNFSTAHSLLKNNETGLVCEMNAESIAQSVLRYIDNEDFKKSIIENLMNQKNTDKEDSLTKFNELIKT